ncbi:MAG: hypothetical protein IJ669_01335, partial [Prevotella sp.]|nr:hypothetical protein [Prevotella sp.]
MKTIEEKAQRYDEAIEKIKYVMEHGVQPVLNKEDITDIFPELKEESEDEMVRKELITWLKGSDGQVYPIDRYNAAIAWLEKQGEYIYTKKDIDDAYLKGLKDAKSTEIKTDPCIDCDQRAMNCHNFPCDRKKAFNGQKPADKVEPKFHKGDWVVDNKVNFVFKVVSVGSNGYGVVNRENYEKTISFDNDVNYHHWSIQDAKDGNILSDGTTIFIFKDLLSDGSVMSYCDYNTGYVECDAFCPLTMNLCGKFSPATKEQREILFMAMANAGYTFDFEKKELKKIECNANDLIEESYQQQADDLIDMVMNAPYFRNVRDPNLQNEKQITQALKESFKKIYLLCNEKTKES